MEFGDAVILCLQVVCLQGQSVLPQVGRPCTGGAPPPGAKTEEQVMLNPMVFQLFLHNLRVEAVSLYCFFCAVCWARAVAFKSVVSPLRG